MGDQFHRGWTLAEAFEALAPEEMALQRASSGQASWQAWEAAQRRVRQVLAEGGYTVTGIPAGRYHRQTVDPDLIRLRFLQFDIEGERLTNYRRPEHPTFRQFDAVRIESVRRPMLEAARVERAAAAPLPSLAGIDLTAPVRKAFEAERRFAAALAGPFGRARPAASDGGDDEGDGAGDQLGDESRRRLTATEAGAGTVAAELLASYVAAIAAIEPPTVGPSEDAMRARLAEFGLTLTAAARGGGGHRVLGLPGRTNAPQLATLIGKARWQRVGGDSRALIVWAQQVIPPLDRPLDRTVADMVRKWGKTLSR